MLRTLVNLMKSPIIKRLMFQTLETPTKLSNIVGINQRYLHITSNILGLDKRALIGSAPKRDEGVDGEKMIGIDNILTKDDMFPDMNTPNQLFNGIPFKDIPIVNIKCSPNNTLMSLSNSDGVLKYTHTCGCEGFKNARKGTNVAAQSTALTLSRKIQEGGYKTIRVRVRGLGPGRAAAIQGLHMGGMQIISITDCTRVTWNPRRPRKAKRL